MIDLARKLTAHRRFALVNGMCFETAHGADWIAGIDADDNPYIFGQQTDGAKLLAGEEWDVDDPERGEPAWLKLDDPATFGALWSLLPAGRWVLETDKGNPRALRLQKYACYNNSDDDQRGIGHSPGESVARALLALWGRAA